MKTELAEGDRSLYAALRERDVNERRAVQLQNLFIHCGYNRFGMNRATEADLCIATADTPTDRLPQLAEAARREGRRSASWSRMPTSNAATVAGI